MTRRSRVLIAGASQSGKSTIAKYLSWRWSRFLGHDPKWAAWLIPPSTTVVHDGAAAAAALPGRVMYHPPVMEKRRGAEDFDVACRKMLQAAGGGIVLHELKALTTVDWCPPGLDSCVWMGAELEIPMIYCTQEPVKLWTTFLTQADIVIVLYLNTTHRQRLAYDLGAEALLDPIPFDHSYGVWSRSDPERLVRYPPLAIPRKRT